jgi:aryl-alcohol dehydrogenase-like predicted oxidoreductase
MGTPRSVHRVQLGHSDLRVSPIGLGAWQFGEAEWGWGHEVTERLAQRIMERALELGIVFFDTAEVYGNGISEEVVGRALRAHRQEVVIATKVSGQHLRYDDVLKAVEGSLRRLGVRELDLYQIHWANPHVPAAETMRALRHLVREGKVRHVGVSNYSLPLLREALAHLDIVANQMLYNLLQREVEQELLPFMRREKIALIAYSPLAKGLLTGKYATELPTDGIRKQNPLFADPANRPPIERVMRPLRDIASRRGVALAQVALNWLRRPGVVPIPGAKSIAQLEENVGAMAWKLTAAERGTLERASRGLRLQYFSTTR